MDKADRNARLQSVDLVRGVVIAIMALDHARHFFTSANFSPVDPHRTTAAYFFTRWVTHFCAPSFSLLAGTSAWFQKSNGKSSSALARFLVSRGLWLVLLELTILRIGWNWSFDLTHLQLITIWALGCSMIVLAALLWMPPWLVGVLSVVVICGHNAFDGVHAHGWWVLIHQTGDLPTLGPIHLLVFYSLVPWIAVMPLGFAVGPLFRSAPEKRRRVLAVSGLVMIAAFIVLRSINLYGDPNLYVHEATARMRFFSFMNLTKYPPSLDYLLATLGGTFLLLAALDRVTVGRGNPILVFGRVPMFFYLLHIFLLHGMAELYWRVVYGYFGSRGFGNEEAGHGVGLGGVYLAWFSALVILYPLCRWYDGVKRRSKSPWLSYL